MDVYDQDHHPYSYYEKITLPNNQNKLSQSVKEEAFFYMNQLEGWCTHNKASILMDLVFLLNPTTIVEIGVYGGKSLVPMACALKFAGKGMIYGIDPWSPTESTKGMEGANEEFWSKVDHSHILRDLEKKIAEFNLQNQIKLIKATSKNAASIPNIDILHIDGNHSEVSSSFDVQKWVPLVRKGGLIVFDDIDWKTTEKALKWLDANCIKLVEYQDSNIWGIWVKS